MRENLDAIKRLVAFALTLVLIGTTICQDVYVNADVENPCEDYVDQYSYTDNGTLVPGQYADGSCDVCGEDEASHVHAGEDAPAEPPAEFQILDTQNGQTGTEDTLVPANDAITPDSPENIDNNTDISNPENGQGVDNPETNTPAEQGNEAVSEGAAAEIPEGEPTDEANTDEEAETEEATEEITDEIEEESEEDNNKECEHKWEYTSNEDGTHVKKCSECEEEATEDCAYDEEGKCKYCGYAIPVEETECEHEWEYTSNEDGTHTRRCVKCDITETEQCSYGDDGLCIFCGAANMALEYQSFSKEFGTTTVTVAGMMPSHSKVTIYKAGVKVAENIVNEKLSDETFVAYEAYNINIFDASGRKYQPEDNDDSVKVSFSGVDNLDKSNEEDVKVFRIEDDYEITEIEADVVGEDVHIDAEHFTTYTVGVASPGQWISFYSPSLIDGFGYVGKNTFSTTTPYLKVNSIRFKLYVDITGTYTFTGKAYKDLTSNTEPDSGVEVATGNKTVEANSVGWYDVEIPLGDITGQDRYVTYGKNYGVVVTLGSTPGSEEFKIGYGEGNIETLVKSGSWDAIEQSGILIEKDSNASPSDYNIELSSVAGNDTSTITAINGPDPTSAEPGSLPLNPYMADTYLYSKGDKGEFTATLSSGKADRIVKWESSNPAVIKLDDADSGNVSLNGKFTAKEAGTATITASYQNSQNTVTKSITVRVIRFEIAGVDPDVSVYSSPYTGGNIVPGVEAFEDASNTNKLTINPTFADNVDVAYEDGQVVAKAHGQFTYHAGSTYFTFNRYFKITPLTIDKAAFANASLTEVNSTVTSVTGIGQISGVTPVFGTDFTATITSATTSIDGKTYLVKLTGKGNFTGTDTWQKVATGDIGITVELTDDSVLNACYYTGSPVTLADGWPEVVFKNSEGNIIDFIKSDNATYVITDKGSTTESNINAGQKTLTFTVTSGGLAGSKYSVDFWILKADLSKATVAWTNGNNEFAHDGTEHKPVAGTDFNLILGGQTLAPSEYTVNYTGDYVNITGVTNIPAIVLTGSGVNFDGDTYLSSQYKIVANYDYDLIVRIQVNNNTYDGNKGNNYVIPYNKTYNGQSTHPNIIVYMNGRTYTKDTDYELSVLDEGKTELTANVGTKVITITPKVGGAFSGKSPITAKYSVVARALTDGMVDISKLTEKTYTGTAIELVPAIPVANDPTTAQNSVYDIKVSYAGNILKKDTDYTISCENNINAGTATFSIQGKGNFKDKVISANYKYTINPAELSKDDATKALVTITPTTFVYNGSSQGPDVFVKINTTEIPRVDTQDATKPNYTITYSENISVGEKSVTVKGVNNLKGEVVLPFTITSDTKAYTRITIKNDYAAQPLAGSAYEETTTDGAVTRHYTCDSVPITYTGSAFTGSVGVYVGEKKLTYGTDYRYAYLNTINAKNYDITSTEGKDASPKLVIYGQGSYKNNNAIVYLNIKPINIADENINFAATEKDDFVKTWTLNTPVSLENLVIKVNGKTLTEGTATTNDYYVTYESDPKPKDAGPHKVVVHGRGNYIGERELPYTIGADISTAFVEIYGAYHPDDRFLDKTLLSNMTEYYGIEDSALTDTVKWRGNTAEPKLYLYRENESGYVKLTPLTAEAGTIAYDYKLKMTPSFGEGVWSSRKTGEEEGTNFNIVKVEIDADAGTTSYYGKATFYYAIYPQNIGVIGGSSSVGIRSFDDASKPYTGEKQTITPVLNFNDGSGTSTELNANGLKDFTPATYEIGPELSDGDIMTKLYGIGNFTGEVNYKSKVTQGNISVFRTGPKDDVSEEVFVGKTQATKDSSNYTITYDLNSDPTQPWYIDKYTYTGTSQIPDIVLTSINNENGEARGPLKLEKDVDYRWQIYDDAKHAQGADDEWDTVSVGKKTIIITINETTNKNFFPMKIIIKYEIVTNSIAPFVGTLSDITYAAEDLTPTQIKGYIPGTTTISLKKTATSETELIYGTDYVIVDDENELTEIKKQSGYEGVTSIRGANNKPSYGTENWIFVKGIGTFSGYKQIFFNTVLDLGSTFAHVYLTKQSYNLNENGATTAKIEPVITYKQVNSAVFAEMPRTSVSGGVTVDNYTVTRNREGLPGPDSSLAVKGQYACKGTASAVRYENGTIVKVVYFLADLRYYDGDDISFADGTVYPYTGSPITIKAIGDILSGATYAENEGDAGDYTIIYTQDPTNHARVDATEVGLWYAVIKATDDATNPSQYFMPNSYTAIPFRIKYNLADAVITFVDPDNLDSTITSTEYTGRPYMLYTNPIASDEKDRGNTKVTIKGKLVYDERSNSLSSNDYFEVDPRSVTTKGEHTVTVRVKNTMEDYAYGQKSATFKITAAGLRTKATWKLYNPDDLTTPSYSYMYIGSGIQPVVKGVLDDGTELKEGKDFKVTYNNNTNVGQDTAYVTITGLGAYAESGTFVPSENGHYSITKLNLNYKSADLKKYVSVEVDEATYSGFYLDPDASSKENVKLTPDYAVYYVDETKGIKNRLQEQTTDNTTGDWKVASWENNTIAATPEDTNPPTLNITSEGTASGNTTGQTKGYFTINQLNLNNGTISIDQDSHEFTGSEIDISDIVKLSTTYVNQAGETVKVPLTIKGYTDIADTECDYTVTISKGNQNFTTGKVTDRGTYSITISGTNSCTSSITKYFTITARSLEDHYHYFYDNGANPGWKGIWEYDSTNKRFVSRGESGGNAEDLVIYVSDVETVDPAGVLPELVIYDTSRDAAGKSKTDPAAGTDDYKMKSTDFTFTAGNNTAAASAGWSKATTEDENGGSHGVVAEDSPYVTITGAGDYAGSITLPFNIGKNIVNAGWYVEYSVKGVETPYPYRSKYDRPKNLAPDDPEGPAAWQYTYNGTPQKPTISVYKDSTKRAKLVNNKDYKITYINNEEEEDASITAGWKHVVITGIGDYCGSMSQMYSINRKAITASGGPYTNQGIPWKTNGNELTISMAGSSVARFTSATLNTYLVETGLMTTAQAAQFEGYYFAVYDGSPIEPEVTVIDNTLGANGTTSGKIGEEDLSFKYENQNVASQFSKADDGTVSLTTKGTITVTFSGTGDKIFGDGNYYVASGDNVASPSYVIHYIIVQHDIGKDFHVDFRDNGLNGPNQVYDRGKNKEPLVTVTKGGQTLEEGIDYERIYDDEHWKPGKHTVTVKGIGNYRGTKSLEYTITASMDDVLAGYYDSNNIFVEEIPIQQYTGTSITVGQPKISLILPKQNDQLEDFKLVYGTNYTATDASSQDGYITEGYVVYSGLPSGYFMGSPTKKVDYNVEFDPTKVTADNYQTSYAFTGHDIIPDFRLSISTAQIRGDIEYYRNDDRSSQTTDFTSVTGENGKITAVIPYVVGNYSGTVEAEYKILPRSLADCRVEMNPEQRYTGYRTTPALTVFIESTDIRTGRANSPYTLTAGDDTTTGDYSIDYGNYIYGDANVVLTGTSDEIVGTRAIPYTIALNNITNLRVTGNTGNSLTVEWVKDLYASGTELELYQGATLMAISKISGKTQVHTFENLTSSTEYTIVARAYAKTSDGTEIKSHGDSSVTATTDIASQEFDVVSSAKGKATISWPKDGTVKHYYIYRAANATDEGTLIAIIPATTGYFTNSKLTSGITYYYHIVGYALVDGKLEQVNTSTSRAVTIK